ncbi:MAG: hypothetical protein A2W91_10380 [Bacteroidetes bacterium GWF2_38_335]|nr:MAG: hypothetical protein A2W91_10380 [Bacteroidetes bacterium GWF2_38_335]OFY81890.1 MAG: hypothetical protein A2281_06660 [Bacteroidetes bacterium RIFOXYA12_FULL_38_20]HBS87967.1 beta-N-acetylhexosaminidase [Bacteroidales bacterium]
MHTYFRIISFFFLLALVSCNSQNENTTEKKTDSGELNLIPRPQSMTTGTGYFVFSANTSLIFDKSNAEGMYLSRFFAPALKGDGPENSIELVIVKSPDTLGTEGYLLEITQDFIKISANAKAGLFYGMQTLRQLLPKEIENQKIIEKFEWKVPCLTIADKPVFRWRGMLLDCCRHFMDKEFVKKYIDLLAMLKMNRFHWHLTEDQGWRIEIKKYPLLTEKSAWRTDYQGNKHGGFYSQEDIREIIDYASERHVEIIPEIEMPGHCKAALASYPEISCTGDPFEVETNWGVHKDVYCAGNENTFEFIENVLDEVIELFPSQYIHIGGDEVPKDRWSACPKCQARIKKEGLKDEKELQSYFIKRVEKYLSSKGKKLIGWDEILEGGLAETATVQSWRGFEGGIEAANSNHYVVMSPAGEVYLDAGEKNTNLKKVYSFNPVPKELSKDKAKYILGSECCMWTESAPQEKVDRRVFPRILALSEVLWTYHNRDFEDFRKRLASFYDRLDLMNVDYGFEESPFDLTLTSSGKGKYLFKIENKLDYIDVYYTVDGSEPTLKSPKYSKEITIEKSCEIKAIAARKSKIIGDAMKKEVNVHKAIGLIPVIKFPYADKYKGTGEGSLTDGLIGSSDNYNDGIWQGFEKENLEAIITFDAKTEIKSISVNFFQLVPHWIFLPVKVEFYSSLDGKTYKKEAEIITDIPQSASETIVKKYEKSFEGLKAKYIKVIGINTGICPSWHQGAGGKCWVFADEIIVN